MSRAENRKHDPYSFVIGKRVEVTSSIGQPMVQVLSNNSQRAGLIFGASTDGIGIIVGIDVDGPTIVTQTKGAVLTVFANGDNSVLKWDTFGEVITGEIWVRRDSSAIIYVTEIVSLMNNQGA